VSFGGEPLGALAPHEVARHGLIRTFQLTRIFPTLTVAENLLVVTGNADGEDRAREMLDFVGLLRLAGQEAASLSYGQQKLLEIAQVLMLRPRMLMLDEPMAGINPGLAEELSERLRELRRRGMTLLLVEHNIPVLQGLCDTVAVLNAGRVMISGPCDEVLADTRVREAFLGERSG
jgi:ABC-type branched-subunit amino acid transport system ATPase component